MLRPSIQASNFHSSQLNMTSWVRADSTHLSGCFYHHREAASSLSIVRTFCGIGRRGEKMEFYIQFCHLEDVTHLFFIFFLFLSFFYVQLFRENRLYTREQEECCVYQRATKRGMQQNVVGPVSKSLSISLSILALSRRYLTALHLKQHKNFQGSRIQPQHSRVQILQSPESKMQTCFRSASDAVQTRIGATIDHFWT